MKQSMWSCSFLAYALLALCALAYPSLVQAQSSPPGTEGAGIPNPEARQLDTEHESLVEAFDQRRKRLEEKGVSYDFLYVSDSLGNIHSIRPSRFTSYSRARGTVDFDFSKLTHTPGLTIHITGLWQTGANLGAYLGTAISPSAFTSFNSFRLDSWWVEKRFASERVAVRIGQFSGEDTYGSQRLGTSFVFQPMAYAFDTLFDVYETFDPLATPAVELRVVPYKHFYLKSMVLASDRSPQVHNLTGFVPQFRDAPVTVSEIGWTPGLNPSGVRLADNMATRHGYRGAYQFGGAYNPGKFPTSASVAPASGNYLVYGDASQALWRSNPSSGRGPDATAGFTWSPADRNFNNRELTLGLRINELIPSRTHYNTVAFGYVRSGFTNDFLPGHGSLPAHSENGLELSALILLNRAVFVQPIVQRYYDIGGGSKSATVVGFRSRVNF